jgi:hypothetical protein
MSKQPTGTMNGVWENTRHSWEFWNDMNVQLGTENKCTRTSTSGYYGYDHAPIKYSFNIAGLYAETSTSRHA